MSFRSIFGLNLSFFTFSLHSKGAVHKVCHATFGQFCWPTPVTLCHTSRDPPKVRHTSRAPIFSTNNPGQKPPVQILPQLLVGVLSEGLLSGRFCPGWFFSVPPSVRIHLLQQ